MGAVTEISWTDSTFNPWWGCARVSPGCENCYAETFAKRTGKAKWGVAEERRLFGDKYWAEPLKWNAKAAIAGKRHRVFCASMADVFEDRRDLDSQRERLWALIEATPWLDWQLLTKRPQNMVKLAPERWAARWPSNVWPGVTIEDQKRAEARALWLIEVPAAVRFVSYEPALEPIDLRRIAVVKPQPPHGPGAYLDALTGHVIGPDDVLPGRISWVIIGGESGHGARPFAIEWARDVVKQCRAAGVAVFMKQLGARPTNGFIPVRVEPYSAPGGAVGGGGAAPVAYQIRSPKGGDLAEWPEDIRVREFPRAAEASR